MNVIYFFIVQLIVNISMYLILKTSLTFVKNKNNMIKGSIFVSGAILFTIISALIYVGMIGWNKEYKEYFEFKVSPERKRCMMESVCQGVDKNGDCVITNNKNLNSANFPPKNPCNGVDMNACQPWTIGWNGNFAMNYNDWLYSNNPVGWKRPDAYGNNMQYIPPQAACNDKAKPNIVPAFVHGYEFNEYSNLHNYWYKKGFNPDQLPLTSPRQN